MEQSSVRTVDKTLRILRLFGGQHTEWGLGALAREVGIPKTTVYRILRVLQAHGFLVQNADSRRFRLGLAALELGRRAYEGLELARVARPIMEQIAALSDETVLLSVLDPTQKQAVCIERVQRRSGLQLILEVGATAPLHAGCTSKVLLAFQPEWVIEAIIAQGLPLVTPFTISDPDTLRSQLAEVRCSGFAQSFEETDIGVAGISVPVRDVTGNVVAALSISGPLARVSRENIARYVELGRQGAGQISALLGYRSSAEAEWTRALP